APGGPAVRLRELFVAILQMALVGFAEVEHGRVQFTAPRHNFALDELVLLLVGSAQHGGRHRVEHRPELVEAIPHPGAYGTGRRRVREMAERLRVSRVERLELGAQDRSLLRGSTDEEVADVIPRLPKIAPQ